jgi:uncharacterized membrane protein
VIPHLIVGGLAVLASGVMILCIWRGHATKEKISYSEFWKMKYVFGWIGAMLLFLVFGSIFIINLWVPIYSEHACVRWGEETDREVRFIHPTYWSWSCTVHTNEGWVSKDAIVKVDD